METEEKIVKMVGKENNVKTESKREAKDKEVTEIL
jgi:hypothetical protein